MLPEHDWPASFKKLGQDCPYFRSEYWSIWTSEPSASLCVLAAETKWGLVVYPTILRALPDGPGFDLSTPYDFGGPVCHASDAPEPIKVFDDALASQARTLGFVSEFRRVHPLRCYPGRAQKHADHYIVDVSAARKMNDFSWAHSSFRRNLRIARRFNLQVHTLATPTSADIRAFHALYTATMQRVDAWKSYRFSIEQFTSVLALPEAHLLQVKHGVHPVAAAIALKSNGTLMYFLGGSDRTSLHMRPNNLLFAGLIELATELDCRILHLGGGGASLRRFKKNFSTGTIPYYVTRRIFDSARYAALCDRVGVEPNNEAFFPAYRLPDQI